MSELTSTTAPGRVFGSRSELAEHYKSDWHKYNLKRRQAGLPVLYQADFQARREAAKALRQQQEQVPKVDHLKKKINKTKKQLGKKQRTDGSRDRLEKNDDDDDDDEKISATSDKDQVDDPMQDADDQQQSPSKRQLEEEEEESAIEIDPRQCLFDKHMSSNVAANLQRMERKYGFFVPDREYLTDLEGLIGFCHEKIKLGHMCLYCQRVFTSWQGCQKHMVNKNHTKLLYDAGVDLEDLAVFYDFAEADAEFLGKTALTKKKDSSVGIAMDEDKDDGDNGNEEWEDISDDEQMEETDEDNAADDGDGSLCEGFEDEVASMGFDVTPLGELVFPDGRIIGHRALRQYYKQRLPRTNDNEAVLAARKASGERLYRGRVYNIGYGGANGISASDGSSSNALALSKAGIAPGVAAGRAGKGLLVPSGPGGSFSQLSIYRYRAAIRKQRRGDFKGQHIYNKTNQNINRMDKKHNRLMNGVSVAHAKR